MNDFGRIRDLSSLRIAAAATSPGFEAEYMARADALNASLRDRIGEGLEGKDAAETLARYLDDVEAEMAGIARAHSRGYWMHLTRRIPPRPLGNASAWTVHLYRRVLTLSVLKHGAANGPADEFSMLESPFGRQQVVRELDRVAAIDAFALEYLAFEYVTATQAYRRVGKGARLVVAGDDFRAVAGSEDLEELMGDVDRRVDEYGELVSSSGISADREFPTELSEHSDAPVAILVAQPNAELIPAERLSRYKNSLGAPANFLLLPLVIEGYREALESLSSEVENATGAELELLLATIWGLSMWFARTMEASPAPESQVLRVGYLMIPDGNWAHVKDEILPFVGMLWEHWTGRQIDDPTAREYVSRGLDALTWSDGALASISLWDRLPFNLILDAGEFRLVDFAALPEMFADVFRQAGEAAHGAGGNTKGANFEVAVAAKVRDAGFETWMESRKLHHVDGAEREIDVGVEFPRSAGQVWAFGI